MKKTLLAFLILTLPLEAATVTLTWDASTGPDVAGYRIKWGFAKGGPYPHIVEVGQQLTTTINEPWPFDTDVYFVAFAYNSLQIDSLPSNEVKLHTPIPTPTPTPTPPPPTPNPTPAPPTNLQLFLQSVVAWLKSLWPS